MTTATSTSIWAQCPAPPRAGMILWDCHVCGAFELARPVFLTNGSTVIATGSGCAAVLVYGEATARTRRLVTTEAATIEFRAAQDAAAAVERRTAYTAALAAFRIGLEAQPELVRARQTYWSTVRHAWDGKHALTFPAFIAEVAATGEIPG